MLEIDKLYKLIKKILSWKVTGTLTINFDGNGGFKKKLEFGESGIEKILADHTQH